MSRKYTAEQRRAWNAKYAASAKGKATKRRLNRAWWSAHPDYNSPRRQKCRANNICVDCMVRPARPEHVRCEWCQRKQLDREQAARMANAEVWTESMKQRDRVEELRELSWIALTRKFK